MDTGDEVTYSSPLAKPTTNRILALAQINPTVGDIEGNTELIVSAIERADVAGANLVVFPELCLPGYPAEDLYLKQHFLRANVAALGQIAAETAGKEITAIAGFAEPFDAAAAIRHPDGPFTPTAHNSIAVLRDGVVDAVYRKQRLPNYAVFDERRYFQPGSQPVVHQLGADRVGLSICEDAWFEGPPISLEAEAGANLIVNASGSPYAHGKGSAREAMFGERARAYDTTIAFCNLAGAQDELVFDGGSFVVGPDGTILARAKRFEQDLLIFDPSDPAGARVEEPLAPLAEIYQALVTGLRDYVGKNGFAGVLVAVSGGIDSALVAMVAADAVGPERLTCVVMPSPHSSEATQGDARAIARNLGSRLVEIPIAEPMDTFDRALDGLLPDDPGVTAENVQARIRGNLMMALSNAHGSIVLTTGNKSEMSVGYATLYGDMAGGFAVIKDVPKTMVYDLVRHRNAAGPGSPSVPVSVIDRAPSAELRPDQRDDDSLPPYEILDRVLAAYVEEDRSAAEIAALGIDPVVVADVIRMVDRAEYKRRQAPPGIRITARAFGRDRRMPITNQFGG